MTKQCDGYPNQECQNEAENHIFGYDLCQSCAKNFVSEGEDELREKLATLTKAADLAFLAIDWQLECWDSDTDGYPPADLLNAHTQLYGLLRFKSEDEAPVGNDLPF